MIHLVLLSGGSGSRLWPLSNDSRSKQFLKVLRDGEGNHVSMVQRVFSQISRIPAETKVTIATCDAQKGSIERQIEGRFALVLEPERRDTTPAIMLACAHLSMVQGADSEDTVVVMPIDTFADQSYYDKVVDLDLAVQSNVADLVLLGVRPAHPSGKYGYIIPECSDTKLMHVAEFKEKPDPETAARFIDRGALWNCGVFAFKLGYVLAILNGYVQAPSYRALLGRYGELPKNSFDYEVVECAERVVVIPYEGQWKDLGTWNTLTEEMEEPYSGRVVVDDATCSNVHVINETGFPMVVAGLRDAVVVATPDGILVSGKEASADIKAQVKRAAASRAMYEQRSWGEYRVIDASVFPGDAKALTKELVIKAGGQISHQRHMHRSEVWTIVSGRGEVVLDGLRRDVRAGSVVEIRPGQMHAARAIEEMHVIEVQTGDILVEDDIERFGYWWDDSGSPAVG